jgi:hypothetical protein
VVIYAFLKKHVLDRGPCAYCWNAEKYTCWKESPCSLSWWRTKQSTQPASYLLWTTTKSNSNSLLLSQMFSLSISCFTCKILFQLKMNNDTLYNSNTTGATSWTGTVYPYGASEFTMHSALSTIVCHFVLFCLTIN